MVIRRFRDRYSILANRNIDGNCIIFYDIDIINIIFEIHWF